MLRGLPARGEIDQGHAVGLEAADGEDAPGRVELDPVGAQVEGDALGRQDAVDVDQVDGVAAPARGHQQAQARRRRPACKGALPVGSRRTTVSVRVSITATSGVCLLGTNSEAVDAGGLGRQGKQAQEDQQELRHQTT